MRSVPGDPAVVVATPQAVALLAYGDADLEPVDLITGPGNIYVTAAKRICRSQVGIDAEAGPTEIAVLADDSADPEHVAAQFHARRRSAAAAHAAHVEGASASEDGHAAHGI